MPRKQLYIAYEKSVAMDVETWHIVGVFTDKPMADRWNALSEVHKIESVDCLDATFSEMCLKFVNKLYKE